MLGPRPRRGMLPFVVMTLVLAPASIAAARTTSAVGSVVETTVAQGLPDVTAPVLAGTPLATGGAGCARTHAQPSRLSIATARAAMLCAINQARAAHGLGALGGERHLRKAAHGHARDMVRHRYFAHQRA